jgi:RimJ/RimL family protein N-acetyltransferase
MDDIVIRPARTTDAPGFNAYRRGIADELENGITYSPGEYVRTVEEERDRIASIIADDGQHLLMAEAHGEIVGQCTCGGVSKLALRHSVGLGIDVHQSYRGRGVGSALMIAMLDWTRAHPVIRRVELDVFTHNFAAIHLYLKFGFVVEGLRRRAYFKDGRFVDSYLMALLFED